MNVKEKSGNDISGSQDNTYETITDIQQSQVWIRGIGKGRGVRHVRGRGVPKHKPTRGVPNHQHSRGVPKHQHDTLEDVPWKRLLGYRKLEELQGKEANAILLTFDKYSSALKKALDQTTFKGNKEMFLLLVRCLAKCCECESLPQQVIDIFTTVERSEFLYQFVEFVKGLDASPTIRVQIESRSTLRDIFFILTKLKSLLPRCRIIIKGILSYIDTHINVIKSDTTIIDDDMWSMYEELMNREDTTRQKRSHLKDQGDDESEEEPDDDFRDYPVFPTTEEVQSETLSKLRHNKTFGGYDNLDHYLDIQYRLLREDFIAPLRDGIREYMAAVNDMKPDTKLHELRIYRDVQIISPICNNHGLCRRISFNYPGMHRIRWEQSKHLIYGSLICLSSDSFRTVWFATVSNRNLDNIRKGLLDIKFEKDYEEVSSIPPDTVFVMVETTAYFEAYRHVLLGLQNVHEGDLPFEKYIVKCLPNVENPAYLRRSPDAKFDLRPLVDEDIILDDRKHNEPNKAYPFSVKSGDAQYINVADRTSWPPPELLHLDISQLRALETALSKELAVIQGPPGTGKTYIGHKIIKSLLHNRHIWNTNPDTGAEDNRPILVVCYTNHALDQFLEGIVQCYSGDVLRLGSRSSSEIMKPLSINSKRMTMRLNREVPLEIHSSKMEIKHNMNSLQVKVNKIADRIEKAKREILHEDAIKHVMGDFYEKLVSGYEAILRDMYGYDFQWEKPQKTSAVLEWLGYGEFLGFEPKFENEAKESQENKDQAANRDVVPEPDNGRENEDEEENRNENERRPNDFINVLDERDVEIAQRQISMEESDEEEESLEDKLNKILSKNISLVALDVSELDLYFRRPEREGCRWQNPKKKNKQLKTKIRESLSSTDRMTDVEIDEYVYDMWDLLPEERWRMYRYWLKVYCDNLQEKIGDKEIEFERSCRKYHEILMQEDKAIMRNSTIIGMTTTCAARYHSVLQEIGPRIIIVEEAAEVLEGHVVTTLSKRCEHLILIGDHQQLKPKPTVYKLAREYNLDLSLFERLANNKLDVQCLAHQHRMRRKISNMMKIIYPNLKDHEVVETYDKISGISEDVYFIDHRETESPEKDLRSHSNKHEAEYLVELCRYLLLQGYLPSQITVLATYSGQLFELKYRMPKAEFEGVRVTVVDNYQGEENDIILLSLVRSNEDGTIGFLKEDNRVCVAMSRAKKGLYVIGNFEMLSRKSTLWRKFVDHARKNRFFGKKLRLHCENHPDADDSVVNAEFPSDFKRSPGGGCRRPCEYRLTCGHTCPSVCHIKDLEHKDILCKKSCTKTCSRGHRCPLKCNQDCATCEVNVPKRMPKCGHTQNVPCYLEPADFKCEGKCVKILSCGHACQNLCGDSHTDKCTMLVEILGQCNHSTKIPCHLLDSKPAFCPEPCGEILQCKHKCKGSCGECHNGRLHKTCKEVCNRILICEHICKEKCNNCPPCKEKCKNRCKHNYCGKQCGEECSPCAENCEWQCEHHRCDQICSSPCERPRCNQPCKERIPGCQHPCVGLCGEPCPKVCRICEPENEAFLFFCRTKDYTDAKFVQLEDCGHAIEVTGLDKWMDEIKDEQIKLKECPKCKTPIRRNLRYGNIIKETLHNIEVVKQRILVSKSDMEATERSIQQGISELEKTDARKMKQIHNELTTGAVDENTLKTIVEQVKILKYVNELTENFETNERRSGRYDAMYQKALDQLNAVHEFILIRRRYFTQQEGLDIENELDHLKLLYQLMQYKEMNVFLETSLTRELSVELMLAEQYLTDRKRLTVQRRREVETTLTALKDVIPLTTIGISEEKRIQIFTVMGLTKGHWFKCKMGHIYAIGDCGGETEESRCPDCNSGIGGTKYKTRDDVTLAPGMDGATHVALSTQVDLGNYDPFEVRFH
ncbi:NFX1-type zinc finger-containing protein 1-like [Mytilus californianus]|uniref:NFX1-type zinc finger-containing protein 1-like n=1 Tax=Mytilus californianus TaxID=6549 RepID=UPI0022482527|nr:NFX1-type zinc finger-containing protein 1-like [Mytilus californianus]